jgi:mono/diheme cytochrome c family protein
MNQKSLLSCGLFCLALFTAACSSAAEPTRFPTATPIPTYNYTQPTTPPQVATSAAPADATGETIASSLDPVKVERGRDRYTVLECGTCHGENGEGTDQGGALVDTALNEGDFITFLRTGGSLGSAHLYSTDRLSDSGGRNLYQFILSLREAGAADA